MTKTEMLDKIAALEAEIANLRAELEKPDMPGPWVPERGESYYVIGNNGSVRCVTWDNDVIDKGALSIGNVFRSKADAEFALERLKVLAELRRLAKGFVPDWGEKQQAKWTMTYSEANGIDIDYFWETNIGAPVYFQSREGAQAAIEAVGMERLKKYYFMVEATS